MTNDEHLLSYLPIFSEIEHLLAKTSQPLCIAIDGNSGSGKSSLANLLAGRFDCEVFHLDDFFLPVAKKTPERLQQPGGNVDYERFLEDVLLPLQKGEPFCYQPYSCKTGQLAPSVSVSKQHLYIIEGSYSMHPVLRDFYAYTIFLQIPKDVQYHRILTRNGPAMLARFQKEWIPLEDLYFSHYHIAGKADIVLDTSFLVDVT